jgi:hypothetical protein
MSQTFAIRRIRPGLIALGGLQIGLATALPLASTMLGAIATHLFVVGGSPALPGVLLVGLLVVVWARRERLSQVLSTHSAGSGSILSSVEGSSVR